MLFVPDQVLYSEQIMPKTFLICGVGRAFVSFKLQTV